MFIVHPQGLWSTSSKKHSDEHVGSHNSNMMGLESYFVSNNILHLG
jgi:hypothetical protein